MTFSDPYTPERGYYECRGCLQRIVTNEPAATCPDCGGGLRNLAVARE